VKFLRDRVTTATFLDRGREKNASVMHATVRRVRVQSRSSRPTSGGSRRRRDSEYLNDETRSIRARRANWIMKLSTTVAHGPCRYWPTDNVTSPVTSLQQRMRDTCPPNTCPPQITIYPVPDHSPNLTRNPNRHIKTNPNNPSPNQGQMLLLGNQLLSESTAAISPSP